MRLRWEISGDDMAVSAKAQMRTVLGDLLDQHGFPYDRHTNDAADDATLGCSSTRTLLTPWRGVTPGGSRTS